MTAFLRTNWPATWTMPIGPTALSDLGLSGKTQLRDTGAMGRTWTETYAALLMYPWSAGVAAAAQANQGWLAVLEQYKARGVIFTISHPGLRSLFGVGTGTPLMDGASQTGASINTKGWTHSQAGILLAGDVLNLAGFNPVARVLATSNADSAGKCAVAIEPPIPAGSSPADSAAITTNLTPGSVLFRARLVDIQKPDVITAQYLSGLTLVFAEMP